MEFKGKEISGYKAISAMLSPEIYIKGKQMGVKWAYLIEMGIKARDQNFENNRLQEQLEKQGRAMERLQRELIKAREECDRWKAQEGA